MLASTIIYEEMLCPEMKKTKQNMCLWLLRDPLQIFPTIHLTAEVRVGSGTIS